MAQFKYIKRGVKRQHEIVQDILPLLEKIASIDGIRKVVPAKISYSPKRGISQPEIKFQRETLSGFKLMAHSKGTIQEIFVVVEGSKRDKIKKELETIMLMKSQIKILNGD